MNNTIKIWIFTGLLLVITLLAFTGISKVKVDDFHKAAIMFVVDASASNINMLPEETRVLRQLCSMLDPEDHIKILRVSESSYIIYEGSPQSSSAIRKSLEKFTQFDEKEYGTAYGLSLKKAFNYAVNLYNDGYIPAVIVFGDLENEGKVENQINWDTLPSEVAQVKAKTDGKISMMFLFAAPQKLDYVKEKLTPVLGEEKLIIGNETTDQKELRKFLNAIGR